jgi:hypothetical protein
MEHICQLTLKTLIPPLVALVYLQLIFYVVGIATGYGLDGRGLIAGRGKIYLFSTASRPALGPTQLPIQWLPGVLFRG